LIAQVLIACTFLTPLTLDSLDNYQECRDKNEKISHVIQWEPLVSKYFNDPNDVQKSLLIIFCESSGREYAVNNNKNGTRDVGLWQFNDNTWAWLKPKLNIKESRYDPETSTAVAKWLIKNDGWYHWNSSKHCWNY